ncbi:hypothetical protein Shell_0879 [Staphylothermus hellenicus DSM 12710]|uniref:Uncharacterized protein n=1 Tax=Staphylothermus hellenicus (strain DSM 12710 / JCM 10830 / BK20S6-10-b1 / P8) TaxID=591019 RepID=D7D893_STAHD|nr:hypothetical protein Shell_0879 [Staphylothermus hellenicus DSM 12710]
MEKAREGVRGYARQINAYNGGAGFIDSHFVDCLVENGGYVK